MKTSVPPLPPETRRASYRASADSSCAWHLRGAAPRAQGGTISYPTRCVLGPTEHAHSAASRHSGRRRGIAALSGEETTWARVAVFIVWHCLDRASRAGVVLRLPGGVTRERRAARFPADVVEEVAGRCARYRYGTASLQLESASEYRGVAAGRLCTREACCEYQTPMHVTCQIAVEANLAPHRASRCGYTLSQPQPAVQGFKRAVSMTPGLLGYST
jgi:hypothetical protein